MTEVEILSVNERERITYYRHDGSLIGLLPPDKILISGVYEEFAAPLGYEKERIFPPDGLNGNRDIQIGEDTERIFSRRLLVSKGDLAYRFVQVTPLPCSGFVIIEPENDYKGHTEDSAIRTIGRLLLGDKGIDEEYPFDYEDD